MGGESLPLWLALAVYHHASVYVDGRKQPYLIKKARQLKEWPEWKEAIIKEIAGLIAMGMWKVPRKDIPEGAKALP